MHIPSVLHVSPPWYRKSRGRALVSYLKEPASWNNNNPGFWGHTNKWESKDIVKIFVDLGFVVDVINFDNKEFSPVYDYDVVFDIHSNLARILKKLHKNPISLLYLTGSYPHYQNRAEKQAGKVFTRNTSIPFIARRSVKDLSDFTKSIQMADHCFLLGNQFTLDTYPSKYHHKISLHHITASPTIFTRGKHPKNKSFLWYFGSGAVLKGLDLTVEVFLRRPELDLHIIGNIDHELDFWSAYRTQIIAAPNIHYHGYLNPQSDKFGEIISKITFLVAPSRSESMSSAVATGLVMGLFPIISRNTGITLPSGCGIYLEEVTSTSIEESVTTALSLTDEEINSQITQIRAEAKDLYSRRNFTKEVQVWLKDVLKL